MSGGWYARRRGAGDHLATGRISLFDDGVHDFLCMNAQSRIDPSSHVPPGIWIGSAKKIWFLTARQDTERSIQRSLQKLERIGWIKRWMKFGQRGDYPILISKFVVQDLSLTRFIVNAASTIDWQRPILEPVEVLSGKCRGAVAPPTITDTRSAGETSSQARNPAPSEEAISLASQLKFRILQNIPKFKTHPGQDRNWALEADRMMRLDGRTASEIRDLIEWSQNDMFWRANILSMKKLRKQFDQLTAKKNVDRKGGLSRAEQLEQKNRSVAGLPN